MAKKAEGATKKTTTKTLETDNSFSVMKELSKVYDQDYFENGIATKKSNYTNYSWVRLGKYFQETAKHIVERFSPSTVLDVGCAKGFLVKALIDLGVRANGIDPSAYAYNAVPEDIKGGTAIGVVQDIYLEDNLFDVVTCFDVLEHIPEADVPKALKEMLRVSKKWVVIRVVTRALPDDIDTSHETIHDKDWWSEKIKEAGGIVDPTETYFNASVWWFNVPEFLIVARKVNNNG